MYDATNLSEADRLRATAAQRIVDYGTAEVSASKLTAILDRVRQSVSMADGARSNFGAELDRLLGCVPTSVGNKPSEPRLNNGVVGDLDDTISDLINTLEILNNQAQRLASV